MALYLISTCADKESLVPVYLANLLPALEKNSPRKLEVDWKGRYKWNAVYKYEYKISSYTAENFSVKGYMTIALRQVDKEITRERVPLAEEDADLALRGGKKMEWNWSVSGKPR